MAVFHLQFDIDSRIHPELHHMLCSIGSSLSQAERLRQLAAMGLIWERVRLQAYGRIEVPDIGLDPAPEPEGGASLSDHAAAPAAQAVPRVDATTARRAGPTDFVDLSDAADLAHLDCPDPGDTEGRPSDHHDADHDDVVGVETEDRGVLIVATQLLPWGDAPELLALHEIRSAVQELPVLTEVVGAAELPHMNAIAATANKATPAAAHLGRGGSMPTGAQIHELAPARKTATRSRLMRMKEKGLFKNE